MKRKLTAMLLTVSMLLTLFPFAAFAAPAEPAAGNEAAVVSAGVETEYATLQGAIGAAKDNDTVKLLKEVTVNTPIHFSGTLTLDLNGYKVLNPISSERPFYVDSGAALTVDGTKAGSGMEILPTNTYSFGFFAVQPGATLELKGGTYTGDTPGAAFIKGKNTSDPNTNKLKAKITLTDVTAKTNYFVFDSDTMADQEFTVNGGYYEATDPGTKPYKIFGPDSSSPKSPFVFNNVTAKSASGTIAECLGGNATFTNCNFEVKKPAGELNFVNTTIGLSYGCTATINGGSYGSNGFGAYVFTTGGTLNIKDGIISGGIHAVNVGTSGKYSSVANISGGQINGTINAYGASDKAKAELHVTGGNFTKDGVKLDVTPFIPENLVQNAQGTVEPMTDTNAIARIGTTNYNSLEKAVKAAKAGDTIVLVNDTEIAAGPENNLVLDKQVIIDGQGHKISRTFDQTAGSDGYGNYEAVFNVNAEGVVIKNVVFDGLDGGSKDEAAIYVNSNNTTIEGCTFNGGTDSGITGILTPGGVGDSLTINNNKFNNLKYGMYFNAINNSIISGNTIDGTKYTGIFVTGSNVTVKDNVLTNIGTAGGNFDPMFYTGIYTTGAAQEKPNTVTGNKVTLAENNTSGEADNAQNTITIGNATYATLADAVAAVKNGETIILSADNTEKITVARNVYFNLELGQGAKFTGTIVAGDGYVLSQSGNQYNVYIPTPVAPSYQVTVPTVQNGKAVLSHSFAAEGATVTITATPDKGFVVDTVVVKDATGKAVTVTKNADGTYSFKMPASKVDVAVTFKAEQTKPTVLPFVDVAENDWFYPAVGFVYEQGMMAGMSDTVFAPNVTLSRAMMAQVLYNMEGTPQAGKGQFTDVKDGDWYANAVNWAAKEGIVAGMGDGTFAPNDNLTREQMAAILYRFAKYSGFDMSAKGDLAGFADASKVSPWAQDSMSWAIGAGIVSGMGDNTLAPQGTATRAQVAMVLLNFCANMNK